MLLPLASVRRRTDSRRRPYETSQLWARNPFIGLHGSSKKSARDLGRTKRGPATNMRRPARVDVTMDKTVGLRATIDYTRSE